MNAALPLNFRKRKVKIAFILCFAFLFSIKAKAQQTSSCGKDSLKFTSNTATGPKDAQAKKISFSGMLIARYVYSGNKEVDINGTHFSEPGNNTNSSFVLRRARLQAKAQLTEKAEAGVLINLTDFIGNPQNKVLENAFVKYGFNKYLNIQVGQYRPYFGREDLYPEELLQSLEWSNLYYAFGTNGWQSFQVGATAFGKATLGKVLVSYYIGAFNGNGRNQPMDNDRGKLFPARVEVAVLSQTKIGLNAGVGKDHEQKIWAFDADVDHVAKLGGAWTLEVQSEFKKGINNSLFFSSASEPKDISRYQICGFYFLPSLKYGLKDASVKSLECSVRYENINGDCKRSGNIRNTFMPMLSAQLANDYGLRLEVGAIIDRYQHNLVNTSQYSSTRYICQLSARF